MSRSLIEILKLGDTGHYYIIDKLKHAGSKEMLEFYGKQLEGKLANSSNARWDIAFTLANVLQTGAWTAYYSATNELDKLWCEAHPDEGYKKSPYRFEGGMAYGTHSKPFFVWCQINFGLCRTTVYNYLEVVDEFATYIEEYGKEPRYQIGEEAKHFQFWQLIEMTSLTYQERLKVQPNWTREEIRAYKKSLREKKNGSVQPAELVEAEEKPMTEAQQRFAKYSKDDLINLVVDLEKDIVRITEQHQLEFERSIEAPVTVEDVLPLKHELTAMIEKQLKAYNYEIHLHGRKQGVKAFAGVLAKLILKSCNSDNEAPSLVVDEDEDPIQQKFAV